MSWTRCSLGGLDGPRPPPGLRSGRWACQSPSGIFSVWKFDECHGIRRRMLVPKVFVVQFWPRFCSNLIIKHSFLYGGLGLCLPAGAHGARLLDARLAAGDGSTGGGGWCPRGVFAVVLVAAACAWCAHQWHRGAEGSLAVTQCVPCFGCRRLICGRLSLPGIAWVGCHGPGVTMARRSVGLCGSHGLCHKWSAPAGSTPGVVSTQADCSHSCWRTSRCEFGEVFTS